MATEQQEPSSAPPEDSPGGKALGTHVGPLRRHPVSAGERAWLFGLLSLPTSLYFLWSPITDFFVISARA